VPLETQRYARLVLRNCDVTLYVTVKLHFRVCPEAFEIARDLQPSIGGAGNDAMTTKFMRFIIASLMVVTRRILFPRKIREIPRPFANAPDALSFSPRALNKFPAGIL